MLCSRITPDGTHLKSHTKCPGSDPSLRRARQSDLTYPTLPRGRFSRPQEPGRKHARAQRAWPSAELESGGAGFPTEASAGGTGSGAPPSGAGRGGARPRWRPSWARGAGCCSSSCRRGRRCSRAAPSGTASASSCCTPSGPRRAGERVPRRGGGRGKEPWARVAASSMGRAWAPEGAAARGARWESCQPQLPDTHPRR